MKKLSFLVITLFFTLRVSAGNLAEDIRTVKTWIDKKYPEESVSRRLQNKHLQGIQNSDADTGKKSEQLRILFPEAFDTTQKDKDSQTAEPEGMKFSSDKQTLFYASKHLETCIIPSSVVTIAHGAFAGCSKLQNITVPDTVTEIGDGAFVKVKSVSISDSHPSLMIDEHGALLDAKTHKILYLPPDFQGNYKIPDGINIIGDMAFAFCPKLTEITIPHGVTKIGEKAFFKSGLSNLFIPDSVTEIAPDAFEKCDNLLHISISRNCRFTPSNPQKITVRKRPGGSSSKANDPAAADNAVYDSNNTLQENDDDSSLYDNDGDGFSNVYELANNFDPNDPLNHPELWKRLKVKDICQNELNIKLVSFNDSGSNNKKDWVVQFNHPDPNPRRRGRMTSSFLYINSTLQIDGKRFRVTDIERVISERKRAAGALEVSENGEIIEKINESRVTMTEVTLDSANAEKLVFTVNKPTFSNKYLLVLIDTGNLRSTRAAEIHRRVGETFKLGLFRPQKEGKKLTRRQLLNELRTYRVKSINPQTKTALIQEVLPYNSDRTPRVFEITPNGVIPEQQLPIRQE